MPRTDASILHADLDSFFASVEQRDDPALRGRPVIVGGGVVLAASYEAKAYGVRTAMGGVQARRLCPHAVVVPPRFDAYTEASRAVFAVFDDTTPLVEGISIDEAFLDVGGLRRCSGRAGRDRRPAARRRPRAGRAGDHGRRRPHQVPRQGRQRRRQARRPAASSRPTASWRSCTRCRSNGCGASARRRPRSCTPAGSTTVGDMARIGEGPLTTILGGYAGRHLHALAVNRDPRHVTARAAPPLDRLAVGPRPAPTHTPPTSTPSSSASSTASRAGCARPSGSGARSRCASASTTSPAPPARTPSTAPTAETEPILAVARTLLQSAHADDRRPRPHACSAWPSATSTTTTPCSWPCRSTATPAARSTPPSTRSRSASARRAVTRTVLLGRSTGMSMPMLPD